MGQSETTKGLGTAGILVHVSICQGSIWGLPFFDPHLMIRVLTLGIPDFRRVCIMLLWPAKSTFPQQLEGTCLDSASCGSCLESGLKFYFACLGFI